MPTQPEPTPIHPFRPGASAFASPVRFSAAKSVRFGDASSRRDTASMDNSLPAWTRGLPEPKFTRAQIREKLQKMQEEMQATFKKKHEAIAQLPPEQKQAKEAALNAELANALTVHMLKQAFYQMYAETKISLFEERKFQVKKLVPEVKGRIFKYKWGRGLYSRFFNRAEYKRTLVALEGPIAVKKMQMWVEEQDKAHLESILPKLKNPKEIREALCAPGAPWQMKVTYYTLRPFFPIARLIIKYKIKKIDTYAPLQNRVPVLPRKEFQAKIDRLVQAYNAKFPNDKIVATAIQDTDKSGSIAQIFIAATTQSGQKVVLKVTRPDANPQFFEACKKALYLSHLVNSGTHLEQKRNAALETENYIHFLTRECNLTYEDDNARKMAQTCAQLGVTGLSIEPPLVSTPDGMIMKFIGEKDLTELSTADASTYKASSGAGVSKIVLLSTQKPLDIHSGNFRTKPQPDTTVFWLDFGRQIELDPQVHANLLRLTVAVNQNNESNYLSFRELSVPVLEALQNLFASTPDSPWAERTATVLKLKQELKANEKEHRSIGLKVQPGQELLDRLKQLNTERDEKEAQLNELQKPLADLLVKLFSSANDNLKKAKEKNLNTGRTMEQKKACWDSYEVNSYSLFSVWANYILLTNKGANGFADLPPISQIQLSKLDIENYIKKFSSFVRPSFLVSVKPESEAIAELKQLSPEQFEKLFEASGIYSLREKIDEALFSRLSFKSETEHQQALQTVLDNTTKRQKLLQVYNVICNVESRAKDYATAMIEQSGLPAADERNFTTLVNSIKHSLINDFNLNPYEYLKK